MAPHATTDEDVAGSPKAPPHHESPKLRNVLAELPIALPPAGLAADLDHAAIGRDFATRVSAAANLSRADFVPSAIWRDVFALTGASHTYYGVDQLWPIWHKSTAHRQAGHFAAVATSTQLVGNAWVEVTVRFDTAAEPKTTCLLMAQLVPDGETWKIWCLSTVLDGLVGQPSVHEYKPEGASRAASTEQSHYDAVIVGGGPSGLCVAGRLAALGVDYLLVDSNELVGDNWRTRYDALRLHTVREYAHLPFERTFGPQYQEWLDKHDLSRGYQDWARRYHINFLGSTRLVSGAWDAAAEQYTLTLTTPSTPRTVTTPNVILAVGACSNDIALPDIPDKHLFRGQTLHSMHHTSVAAWPRSYQSGVVIGTANTAHDIACEMADAGLHTTMVQRGQTWVVPREWYQAGASRLYNAQIPTGVADLKRFAMPLGVSNLMTNGPLHAQVRAEPERFDAIEAKGFKVERFGDLGLHLYERGGGHYMDTGSCARIAAGEIGVKDGAAGYRFTPSGLEFGDGSTVEADVVVFATGFDRDVRRQARKMFGDEVAARLDSFWGVTDEGEVRGAWQPQRQAGMWMAGGELGSARFFSSLVALQVAARVLGTPLPVLGRDF